MPESPISFAAQVWQKLAVIDVTSVIEKKGNLSYVSWSSCWTDLKRVYPDTTFTRLPDTDYANGTVDVNVVLTIAQGDDQLPTPMWLPVMDMRNNSIENPTSRQRSDSAMRALVKAAAVHGYGLSLWRGTELVDASDFTAITLVQADELRELLEASKVNKDRFLKAAGADRIEHIPAVKFAPLKAKLEAAQKRKPAKASHDNP